MAYFARRVWYVEDFENDSYFAIVVLVRRKEGKPVRYIVYCNIFGTVEVMYFDNQNEARQAFPFGIRNPHSTRVMIANDAEWLTDVIWPDKPRRPGLPLEWVRVKP